MPCVYINVSMYVSISIIQVVQNGITRKPLQSMIANFIQASLLHEHFRSRYVIELPFD